MESRFPAKGGSPRRKPPRRTNKRLYVNISNKRARRQWFALRRAYGSPGTLLTLMIDLFYKSKRAELGLPVNADDLPAEEENDAAQ